VAQYRETALEKWGALRIRIWVSFVTIDAASIPRTRGRTMPRYVIERDFPDGLQIPVDETGAKACLGVVESNLADQVTWLHSYVSTDKRKSFCIYDAPSPEAIRRTAARSKLPVGVITEVRVLDPYFYK
jgi:hypothetical protein